MSFLHLFEVSEVFWVFKSLQKSVDVFQVGKLGLQIPHSAGQNIRNGSFTVKFPAKLLIRSNEQSLMVIAFRPNCFKPLKVLQFQCSNPLLEILRV
jgi:hypothetical protein